MQIDPELAVFLEQPFPNNFDDLAWSRREQRRLASENPVLPSSTVTWVDTSIGRSASGEDLRARVYRHRDADESSEALLFFHGGAFVFGDLDSEHARCVRYCDDCARVVVSVDYALAPEHPFPAAFDDAVTSFDWMVENSADLGIDPALIAVGGVSAGGAVASGLVLHLRDRGAATPRAQLLVYPVIDSRTDTPSMHQFFRAEPFDGERAQRRRLARRLGRARHRPERPTAHLHRDRGPRPLTRRGPGLRPGPHRRPQHGRAPSLSPDLSRLRRGGAGGPGEPARTP